MKVKGLDNKTYVLSLKNKRCFGGSSLHSKVRDLLKLMYGSNQIIEEVHIPGCPSTMYLDFFIPNLKMAIEVQGEQHYKFNRHFFKDERSHLLAKKRDRDKKEWCVVNDFCLVELRFDETIQQWKEKLQNV